MVPGSMCFPANRLTPSILFYRPFGAENPGSMVVSFLTPHAAWYSPDGHADMRRKAAATIADYLTNGTLRNVVNGVSR